MDHGPLFRKPSLINDKGSITTPSPDHMQDSIDFVCFNYESFGSLVTEITLDTPPQLLEMATQKMGRTTDRCGKINP
jgi:hypothetical protein